MISFTAYILLAATLFGGKASQEVQYPHPVSYITVHAARKSMQMAYMDVQPLKPNGQTVLLLHGKNFNGFYWKPVISFLSGSGFRVVVPDQVGWGKSDKPNLPYSFHMLAANTAMLLDSLHIGKVNIIGHSMGGMLAVRFVLMYPDRVSALVLENPIGLEDYRTFVPYRAVDTLYQQELAATYESYKQYQQSYYARWKPEYEELVRVQADALSDPGFKQIAWVNALTYQMIYEQPVCYELSRVKVRTLLIIGQDDRTIVGKAAVPPDMQALHGQYPQLGKNANLLIEGSRLVSLPGVGHIPHVEDLQAFKAAVSAFLQP